MKKSSKTLLMMFSAVTLVATSVFGTIAYFTDSDSATNTFTVGQVLLDLDEAKVNTDGTYVRDIENRDIKNKYHLMPGHTYIKDPTVHVEAKSENCYVFVTVKNQIAEIEWNDDDTYDSIEKQMKSNGWEVLIEKVNDVNKNVKKDDLDVFVYNGDKADRYIVPKNTDQTDLIVFENFRIDGDSVIGRGDSTGAAPTGMHYIEDYKTVGEEGTIVVTAYAVQADGFETALAAWKTTYGK